MSANLTDRLLAQLAPKPKPAPAPEPILPLVIAQPAPIGQDGEEFTPAPIAAPAAPPTQAEMIVELEAAGWKRRNGKTDTWVSPWNALFLGPAQAWKVMRHWRGGPDHGL